MRLQKNHFMKIIFGLSTAFLFFVFIFSLPNKTEAVMATDTGSLVSASTVARCDFLLKDIRFGSANNDPVEVAKVQYFLSHYEGFSNIGISGVYDTQTLSAVIAFQTKYKDQVLKPWGYEKGTGVVYFLTRNKINEIVCGITIPLTASQEKEIQDFNAVKSTTAHTTSSGFTVPVPVSTATPVPVKSTPTVSAPTTPAPVSAPASNVGTTDSSEPTGIPTPTEILKEESNKKIFGGWFPTFGAQANVSRASVFSLPRGINAVESVILFIIALLILNVISTLIGKSRPVVFIIGSIVAVGLSLLFNRAYLVVPFLIVLATSVFVFLRHNLKKSSQEYEDSVFGVEPEPLPDVIVHEPAHEPVHMMLPVEEPEVKIEPAVVLESHANVPEVTIPEALAPVVESKTETQTPSQQEVKIIMGHVVPVQNTQPSGDGTTPKV